MQTILFANQIASTSLDVKPVDTWLEVDCRAYQFSIEARNSYCDRGAILIHHLRNKNVDWNPVDSQDFFPRFYLSLQRGLDELSDFINKREAKIDFTQTEPENPDFKGFNSTGVQG